MFYHFIIHTEFEHGLSHSRANGSPSEEPNSALSNDLTVHRIGKVWWRHDSVSKAWSGGIKSCSYWHQWWIGRTQTPFPWTLLILFDRDQRHDRDYTTHGNAHNPLFCPGGNRFTNPALVWAELIWLWSGRVHSYTVLLAPVQSPQIVPCKNWNWKLEPVNWTSEPLSTANQCLTFLPRPFLHGMVSCVFHGCLLDGVFHIHHRCRYEQLPTQPGYALEPESWRDQTYPFHM